MNKQRPKVGLFCDRVDWITGTAAQHIMSHETLRAAFDFCLLSQKSIFANPLQAIHLLQSCSVVHWISPYGYWHFAPLVSAISQICNIHHVMPDDEHWPREYLGVQIVSMSRASGELLKQRDFNNVKIVRYGVDTDTFADLVSDTCRLKLGLERITHPLIGFFGKASSNVQGRKGDDTLFQALVEVNRKQQAGLLLSGEGWNSLVERCEQAKIPVYHRQVKNLTDMPLLYGAIDLYVCTSRVEGGPIPVLEAMACERPVISTPVGHVPELVRHEQNGIIVPIDDPITTAEAIVQLLCSPARAQRLAHAGRKTVLQEWTWQTTLSPLDEIYRSSAALPRQRHHTWKQTIRSTSLLFARSWRYRLQRASFFS